MSAEELGVAMDDRRLQIRLRWSQVAQRAQMDPSTLRRIRKGEIALTSFAATGIDQAMDWPAGTTWAIYHGTDLPAGGEPDLRDDFEAQIWALDLMSEEVRWAVIEIHREAEARRPRNGGHNQSA